MINKQNLLNKAKMKKEKRNRIKFLPGTDAQLLILLKTIIKIRSLIF
jgi:hypothetical protein